MQGDWVIRTPCETSSRVFRLLERTFHRLRLLFLLDLRSSPTVLSISLLIALSKPCHPHQKQVGATYYTNIQEP